MDKFTLFKSNKTKNFDQSYKTTFLMVYSRLVNLTDEDDRKLGLNMTETNKPYLLKHDRKSKIVENITTKTIIYVMG